jgi:RNA polymerase sigma factor (sigma-70 family)
MVREQLTEEQQRTVEDNIALAYFQARKYAAPYGWDWEDWVAECKIQLVRAVIRHDPAKGTLSSLLDRYVVRVRGNLNKARRVKKRTAPGRLLSIDVEIDKSADGDTMQTLMGVDNREPELIAIREFCQHVLGRMNPTAAKIFQLFADGMTHQEAADTLGRSRQRMTQLVNQAREMAGRWYPEDVYHDAQCARCGKPISTHGNVSKRYCGKCSRESSQEVARRYWEKKGRHVRAENQEGLADERPGRNPHADGAAGGPGGDRPAAAPDSGPDRRDGPRANVLAGLGDG